MSEYKIDTSRLKNDYRSIQNNLQKIRTAKSNLELKMSELDSMWDGPSNESFRAEYQGDIQRLQAMIDSLDKICRYEENAYGKYDGCEKKVFDLISGL